MPTLIQLVKDLAHGLHAGHGIRHGVPGSDRLSGRESQRQTGATAGKQHAHEGADDEALGRARVVARA